MCFCTYSNRTLFPPYGLWDPEWLTKNFYNPVIHTTCSLLALRLVYLSRKLNSSTLILLHLLKSAIMDMIANMNKNHLIWIYNCFQGQIKAIFLAESSFIEYFSAFLSCTYVPFKKKNILIFLLNT